MPGTAIRKEKQTMKQEDALKLAQDGLNELTDALKQGTVRRCNEYWLSPHDSRGTAFGT